MDVLMEWHRPAYSRPNSLLLLDIVVFEPGLINVVVHNPTVTLAAVASLCIFQIHMRKRLLNRIQRLNGMETEFLAILIKRLRDLTGPDLLKRFINLIDGLAIF